MGRHTVTANIIECDCDTIKALTLISMSDCHCLTLLCTALGDYCKFPVSLALAIIIITFLRSCLIFRKVKHHSKRRPSAMPYTRRSEEQFLRGVSFKEILWAPAPRDNSYTYRRCFMLFKRLRHNYVYFIRCDVSCDPGVRRREEGGEH